MRRKLPPGKSIELGAVRGNDAMRHVVCGVACRYDLAVYGMAVVGNDTVFTYKLHTDYALPQAERNEVRAFIAGMVEMWRLIA